MALDLSNGAASELDPLNKRSGRSNQELSTPVCKRWVRLHPIGKWRILWRNRDLIMPRLPRLAIC